MLHRRRYFAVGDGLPVRFSIGGITGAETERGNQADPSEEHVEHRALPMSQRDHIAAMPPQSLSIAYPRSLAASRASRLASLNLLTASLPASLSFSWPL